MHRDPVPIVFTPLVLVRVGDLPEGLFKEARRSGSNLPQGHFPAHYP